MIIRLVTLVEDYKTLSMLSQIPLSIIATILVILAVTYYVYSRILKPYR